MYWEHIAELNSHSFYPASSRGQIDGSSEGPIKLQASGSIEGYYEGIWLRDWSGVGDAEGSNIRTKVWALASLASDGERKKENIKERKQHELKKEHLQEEYCELGKLKEDQCIYARDINRSKSWDETRKMGKGSLQGLSSHVYGFYSRNNGSALDDFKQKDMIRFAF